MGFQLVLDGIEDAIIVEHEFFARSGKPEGGDLGYLVRYKDGYQAWSPTGPFEEGYTKFQAFEWLKSTGDQIHMDDVPEDQRLPEAMNKAISTLTDRAVSAIDERIWKKGEDGGATTSLYADPVSEDHLEVMHDLADELQDYLRENLPNNRLRSIALTNIEQGMLWANACADVVDTEAEG